MKTTTGTEETPGRGAAGRRVACQHPNGRLIQVSLTGHLIERFGERVRPALGEEMLAAELTALIENFGRVLTDPPAWQAERGKQKSDLYIELGEGLVVAVNQGHSGYYATTVLTRSGISDKARANRNQRKRSKRRSRNARRRSH